LRATRNNRRLPLGDTFVRNGDRFTVRGATRDGLVVEHTSGTRTTLPAAYVREHATYGWASTVDAAQGATVDVGILLARPGLDREHLYVGLTRGRDANHIHLAPSEPAEDHHLRPPEIGDGLAAAEKALTDALARTGRQTAAHTRLPETERARSEYVEPAVRALDRALLRERYLAPDHGLERDFGR
jgi:ATP-dependent exoDNAse (exonuclease V) alpha subunit